MAYIEHVAILILLYTTLAVSLDLVVGRAGMLAVAHAAFYGIGAYTSALLSLHFHVPFLLGAVAGMSLAAAASLLVSMLSARLRGDYFVIATFCFQIVVFSVMQNWTTLTRGPLGLAGIPHPKILGWQVDSGLDFVLLAGFGCGIAYLVVGLIATSPLGRVLHAIREDEMYALACGKNTLRTKIMAFLVSSAVGAFAGAVYAHYIRYIDPTSFTVLESILILSMVVIGGAGSLWGPLVGAVLLVSLPEALRFLDFSASIAANIRQVLYGVLIVVMMIVRPHGIVGRYGFGR